MTQPSIPPFGLAMTEIMARFAAVKPGEFVPFPTKKGVAYRVLGPATDTMKRLSVLLAAQHKEVVGYKQGLNQVPLAATRARDLERKYAQAHEKFLFLMHWLSNEIIAQYNPPLMVGCIISKDGNACFYRDMTKLTVNVPKNMSMLRAQQQIDEARRHMDMEDAQYAVLRL